MISCEQRSPPLKHMCMHIATHMCAHARTHAHAPTIIEQLRDAFHAAMHAAFSWMCKLSNEK